VGRAWDGGLLFQSGSFGQVAGVRFALFPRRFRQVCYRTCPTRQLLFFTRFQFSDEQHRTGQPQVRG
jgi:hypothetical protein